MSGPKIDYAELERRRQEELRLDREALTKFTSAKRKFDQLKEKINNQIRQGIISEKDVSAILALIKDCEEAISKNSGSRASNNETAAFLEQKLGNLLNTIELSEHAIESIVKSIALKDALAIQSRVADFSNIDFSNDYDQVMVESLLNDAISHYDALSNDDEIINMKSFALKAYSRVRKISKNKQYNEIESVLQTLVNAEFEIRRQDEIFHESYDEYVSLSTILNLSVEKIEAFNSIDEVQTKVDELSELYRKKDEMDFIADQINSTMTELGYSFVSSRTLFRKDKSEIDYSLYQADDRTGISIFTDQSGAVMMRVTVIGDDTDITDDDRAFSYERQLDFCSCHPDIVDALRDKGIYLKQKSHSSPDPSHTFKVKSSEHSETTTTSTSRRERRARGKTSLRKMQDD